MPLSFGVIITADLTRTLVRKTYEGNAAQVKAGCVYMFM